LLAESIARKRAASDLDSLDFSLTIGLLILESLNWIVRPAQKIVKASRFSYECEECYYLFNNLFNSDY